MQGMNERSAASLLKKNQPFLLYKIKKIEEFFFFANEKKSLKKGLKTFNIAPNEPISWIN